MKIAVYADHVGRQCYDVFDKDGSRSLSEALSRRADVSDALDFDDNPYISPEATKKILELRETVWGMCFDYFGERGHMGESIDQDVDEVLDKLVICHLSPQQIEEAEADCAHEDQFLRRNASIGDDTDPRASI